MDVINESNLPDYIFLRYVQLKAVQLVGKNSH